MTAEQRFNRAVAHAQLVARVMRAFDARQRCLEESLLRELDAAAEHELEEAQRAVLEESATHMDPHPARSTLGARLLLAVR